jgi:hypothetical protein
MQPMGRPAWSPCHPPPSVLMRVAERRERARLQCGASPVLWEVQTAFGAGGRIDIHTHAYILTYGLHTYPLRGAIE